MKDRYFKDDAGWRWRFVGGTAEFSDGGDEWGNCTCEEWQTPEGLIADVGPRTFPGFVECDENFNALATAGGVK